MHNLPEYQKVIRDSLADIEPIVEKYTAKESPLEDSDALAVATNFQKAREHCRERLASDFPKIMLYGVYNSGKSTLLNALMGEERAAVGDIPKTDKITSYQWKGYELLDTPGINAPIEHQRISIEALAQCQVVFFVISAARSFENKAIFEAMRDVVRRDKHLFIVLNDKEGLGQDNSQLSDVQRSIQSNLINVGFSREQAASFRLCVVDAKMALEGRLMHDEALVTASGILDLERLAVEEIKRVNGFGIVADLCGYLSGMLTPFVEQLRLAGNAKSDNKLSEFLTIRKEYSEFCATLESKIVAEAAPMPNAIMACFPSVENASAAQSIDDAVLKEKISSVYSEYGDTIHALFSREVADYRNRLAEQLQQVLDVVPVGDAATPEVNEDMTRRFGEILTNQPQARAPEAVAISGNELCDKIDKFSSVLGGTSIASTVLKLPIPLPVPPVLLPVGAVLMLLPKLFRAIFGKSEAELENERIEAQAAAMRRAEEEHARDVALWRQQLRQHCQDIAASFLREVKNNTRTTLDNMFNPILIGAEDEFRARNIAGKEIIADAGRLQDILAQLTTARSVLVEL